MARWPTFVLLAAVVCAAPRTANAQGFFVVLNAGIEQPRTADFAQISNFPSQFNSLTLSRAYHVKTSVTPDVSVGYLVTHGLGGSVGLTYFRGGDIAQGTVAASTIVGGPQTDSSTRPSVTNFRHGEAGIHADVVYALPLGRGPIQAHVFAGWSWVKVKQDVIGGLYFTESFFPLEVAVTRIDSIESSASAGGSNVGGDVTFLGGHRRRIELAVSLRRVAATVNLLNAIPSLHDGSSTTTPYKAGGTIITGGVVFRLGKS